MRRTVTWIAGLVGIAALARWIRGRRRASVLPESDLGGADPALELRSKLAETREQPSPDPGATVETDEIDGSSTIDERRARIHEKAQQAIDEMSAES
jgi:hypothetical protein